MGLLGPPILSTEEKQKKALDKATMTRSHLILDAPFFGTLTARLKLTEDHQCDTLYTDGVHLGYNPDKILEMRPDHLKAVYAKSIVHLILGHHVRRKHRDEKIWKKATNRIAEAVVKQAGFVLPDESGIDLGYADRYAEEVYAELESEIGQDQPSGSSGQSDGDQNSNAPSPGAGQNDGDGNGNQPQQPDASPNGEVRDLPPNTGDSVPSQSDKDFSEQEWKSMGQNAARAAEGMGDLPGGIDRLIKSAMEHKLYWREVLREWVEKTAYKDYTFMKPNRRYVYHGLILPSLESGYDVMKARAYVDASGSVYDRQLQQFSAEISSILEEFPEIEFTCKYFDTNIKHRDTQIFTKEDLPIVMKTRAGGGTDFRPIFKDITKDIEDTGEEPKFVLIFTDMECSRFPADHPDYPVLWLQVGKSRWAGKPPFGDVLPLELDPRDYS